MKKYILFLFLLLLFFIIHLYSVEYLEENNASIETQITEWVPNCIIEPADFDISVLTSSELRSLLLFVRGDEADGAAPLV